MGPVIPGRLTFGALATTLMLAGQVFRKSPGFEILAKKLEGEPINEESVRELIAPVIALAAPGHEQMAPICESRLTEYAPTAQSSIRRNSHMNKSDGETNLNQVAIDAVIVDFINFAAMPVDLAMYTSDLYT